VTVKVKFADFHRSQEAAAFQLRSRAMISCGASVVLMRTLLPTAKAIRLLGVTVSNFDRLPAAGDLPLFGAREVTCAHHLAPAGEF
jgi:DNA polymerase IV